MPVNVRYEKPQYDPAPEGLHIAVCCDVVDLGMVDTTFGKKPQVRVMWQLEELNAKTQQRFRVQKTYTPSLNEKANLRKDLEAWIGKKFTAAQLDQFSTSGLDLEKMIGKCCQIQVTHKLADNGTVYSNVTAIVPLGKNMTAIRVQDYERVKDREGAKPQAPLDPFEDDLTAGDGSGDGLDSDINF